MSRLLKMLSNPIVTCTVLFIALIELFLLFRHEVFKNALISRGLLNREPIERADYYCIQGWENTLRKLNYKADVCFIGNSITFHSNFQKDYPDKKIVNLGYSGDDINGMIVRHKQIASVRPDKIFIMAGHNDLMNKHITMTNFKELYKQLIDSIHSSNPQSKLYLESILPVNHQLNAKVFSTQRLLEANRVIKELSVEYSFDYIDLFSLYADKYNELQKELTPDGIHLYPSSYKKWSEAIKKYIE